jgi:hypothetical protein
LALCSYATRPVGPGSRTKSRSCAISTRMRETLDVESVLKTAAREIGEALELHDLAIQLEMNTEGND